MGAFDNIVCDQFGGPANYLRTHLKEGKDRASWVQWLWRTFPRRGDIEYSMAGPVRTVPSYGELGNYVPLKFHVAFLAYDKGASLKPDPELNVCKSLAAEILRDGFSTSGEPLLLKQCDGEDIKSCFCLGGGTTWRGSGRGLIRWRAGTLCQPTRWAT